MAFFRRSNLKKRTRRKRVVISFTFLVLLSLSVAIYFFLPHLKFLKLKSVVVKGVQRGFQVETVLQKSGLHLGEPLFSINLENVISQLKNDPWVDQIQVTQRIPSILIVQINEYEPKLILNLDKLYYISNTGKIFKELEVKDSKEFPVLTGMTRQEFEQKPYEMKQILLQGIELLEKYQKSEFARRFGLSKVHYDGVGGFNLFPEKQNLKIIVGSGDFDTKLKRLELAIRQLGDAQRSFSTIDLNYEGKVVLTIDKGG